MVPSEQSHSVPRPSGRLVRRRPHNFRPNARGAFVFMNRVGPDGMMIVPVGQTERAAIPSESQSLTEQLERAIGYQPSR